jgi:hypothetical protein
VTTVRLVSSQSSGSGWFGGLVGAGPGFGPQPPAIVQPGRLQSSGGHGSHPSFPGQYPPYPMMPSGCVPPGQPKKIQGLQPKRPQGMASSKSFPGQPGPKGKPMYPHPHPKSLHLGFFSLGVDVGLGSSSGSLSSSESLSESLSHVFGTQKQAGTFVNKKDAILCMAQSTIQSFGLQWGSR